MVENNKGTSERQHGTGKPAIRGRVALRFTLGVRFVSFVVLVALLAGGVVGFALINTSRDSIRQEALHNNLAQADLAAEFASNYVKAVQAGVRSFAARPTVVQAVLSDTLEKLQVELSQFVQIEVLLEGTGIYDAQGIQRVSSMTNATTIGQSFADRDWFKQAVATRQPSLSIPVISRVTGVPIVPYAVPILDEQGKVRGVVTSGISLGRLSDAIVNIKYGTDTRASLMDSRNGGLILAHSDPQRLLTQVSGKNEAARRVLAGERGVIETTSSSGEVDLIGFAPVPDLPWGIMVITPSKTALAIVDNLTQNASLFTGFAILFAAIVGVVLVLGVTRPVRRLVEGTKEIGRGNLDYKVVMAGRDEIGTLSRAFGDMTEKLKNTLVSRDELVKEVAERKRTEMVLKESQEFSTSLLESSPYPVIVSNQDGSIKYANPVFENLTGFAITGIIGTKPPRPWWLPENHDEHNALLRETIATGKSIKHERIYKKKNGEIFRVELTTRDIFNEGRVVSHIAYWVDITERKKAEETLKNYTDALRQSEEKYRELFQNAEVGMYRSRLDGSAMLDVNRKLCEIFGYTREEMLSNPATIRWADPKVRDVMVKQVREKGVVTDYEIDIVTKDGEIKTCLASIRLFPKEGYIEGSAIDITERRRLEQERDKFTEELKNKNTELERFTYTVSHDLKSPLVTIKTFLGYLKQDIAAPDAGRIEQDMLYMNGAADKMGKLLEELLEMSRIGRIINPAVTVTFQELVQETLNLLAGRIEERVVKVQVSDDPITLSGDRPRLVEIWQNLVENAVKFMGDQPSPCIDIGVERRSHEAVFFVRDNGIGIDTKYQPRLFNLFEKINPRSEGTGMGLAITKRIVELYKGKIWVESQGLGQGTCFWFTLPGALKDKSKGG